MEIEIKILAYFKESLSYSDNIWKVQLALKIIFNFSKGRPGNDTNEPLKIFLISLLLNIRIIYLRR